VADHHLCGIRLCNALLGASAAQESKKRRPPLTENLIWGIGLNCLLFVPLGAIEYVLQAFSLFAYQPLSLEYLVYLVINTKQTIYTAGTSKENPMLLWLDGGPGGSDLAWVRKYLGPLHQQSTIVCYDQRGVAASFNAAKK
jgi:pimeloyl-ACP methyl ester carboxylesterase